MITTQPEVHPTLKASTLAPTHFIMGENVVRHDGVECTAKSGTLLLVRNGIGER
jgi:hypothetical protein